MILRYTMTTKIKFNKYKALMATLVILLLLLLLFSALHQGKYVMNWRKQTNVSYIIEPNNTLIFKQNGRHVKTGDKPHINPVFYVNWTVPVDNHIILFWNVPSWFEIWMANADMKQCIEYQNCLQSSDRSLFNKSKAVVYNLPEENLGTKPPVSNEFRDPQQFWVFFTLESPAYIRGSYTVSQWKGVFNWSWSYHPNADIFHPYGVLVERSEIPDRNYTSIFRKKTKLAAWAVSHCKTQSRRMEYVNFLRRYVDVDVFGKCGNGFRENLDNEISMNYKFYLGFENSLCENYMTEKFFHYYTLDVIVIVRGKTEYHRYLPAGSFIDTADFPTISALGNFLKELASDEDRYISYLKIKDRFMVYEWPLLYKDAICNLCEKLNTARETTTTYTDVRSWLGKCVDTNDLIVGNSSFDVSYNDTDVL